MSETQNNRQLQRKLGARHLNMTPLVAQLVQVYSLLQGPPLPTQVLVAPCLRMPSLV